MLKILDSNSAIVAISSSELATVCGGGGGDGNADELARIANRGVKAAQASARALVRRVVGSPSAHAQLTPPGYCPAGTGRNESNASGGFNVELPNGVKVGAGGGYSSSTCEAPG